MQARVEESWPSFEESMARLRQDPRRTGAAHTVWQTTLVAPALEEAARAARAAGARLVSRGVAELGRSRLGLGRAVLMRDPDGHARLLMEPAGGA